METKNNTNYIATLDLGSNTFQCLVCTYTKNHTLEVVLEESFPVKLYFDQNETGKLSTYAIQRAQIAIQQIINRLQSHPISEIQAYATAAFRELEGGIELANWIQNSLKNEFNNTKIKLEIITGNTEANTIALAQEKFLPQFESKNALLIDIGGGSVEFISTSAPHSLPAEVLSLQIGVARLAQQFNISFDDNLLQQKQYALLLAHLNKELDILSTLFCRLQKPLYLIGIGGSFETNAVLLSKKISEKYAYISIQEFEKIAQKLLNSTSKERANNTDIPSIRKDLILIANTIVETLFQKFGEHFSGIIYSAYDLKYGLMAKLFSKK